MDNYQLKSLIVLTCPKQLDTGKGDSGIRAANKVAI